MYKDEVDRSDSSSPQNT